ncbi:MAG: class I SAM-dependent methyltransferase [Candidatus Hodarchaeales archaeon]
MDRRHRSQIIVDLIHEYNIEVMAEIGVWRGRTMKRILRSDAADILKEYWAVDIWKAIDPEYYTGREYCSFARVHTTNVGPDTYRNPSWQDLYLNSCKYMPWFKQLRVVRASSVDTVEKLWPEHYFPDGYFDLVFIDADHHYEAVKGDILSWLRVLKRSGIMCGHDYKSYKYPGVAQAVDEIFGEKNIIKASDHVWIRKFGEKQ